MQIERIEFETLDSTNSWAKLHCQEFNRTHLTVVSTKKQTAGYGRQDRKWISNGENITATFCFFIPTTIHLGNLSQLLALSAVDLLNEHGFFPTLKWPNDLLLSEKKVSGILCETRLIEQQLCFMGGIGINVNMQADDFCNLNRPATSLLLESGKKHSIALMLTRLETIFHEKLIRFLSEGFAPFYSDYLRYIGIGKIVTFHHGLAIWRGIIDSIDTTGALQLRLSNGELKTFVSGEID